MPCVPVGRAVGRPGRLGSGRAPVPTPGRRTVGGKTRSTLLLLTSMHACSHARPRWQAHTLVHVGGAQCMHAGAHTQPAVVAPAWRSSAATDPSRIPGLSLEGLRHLGFRGRVIPDSLSWAPSGAGPRVWSRAGGSPWAQLTLHSLMPACMHARTHDCTTDVRIPSAGVISVCSLSWLGISYRVRPPGGTH